MHCSDVTMGAMASQSPASLFIQAQIKETPKLCVDGLCEGNSPVTGEFPAQMAINAENVSIWWRHHDIDLITGECSTQTPVLHPPIMSGDILTYEGDSANPSINIECLRPTQGWGDFNWVQVFLSYTRWNDISWWRILHSRILCEGNPSVDFLAKASNAEIYDVLWTTCRTTDQLHDDVIKWKHFPRNWPFVRGIHRSPVNSPHNGQWRGALMFSLICAWINAWVNNGEAGDLRRYRAHYDVIVMRMVIWDAITLIDVTVTWITSHERHCVPNHRPFECLFDNLFGLTSKNHQSST